MQIYAYLRIPRAGVCENPNASSRVFVATRCDTRDDDDGTEHLTETRRGHALTYDTTGAVSLDHKHTPSFSRGEVIIM